MYRDEQRIALERRREHDAREKLAEIVPPLEGKRRARRWAGLVGLAGWLTLPIHPLISYLRADGFTYEHATLHLLGALIAMLGTYLVVQRVATHRARATITAEAGDTRELFDRTLERVRASTSSHFWPLLVALALWLPLALHAAVGIPWVGHVEFGRWLIGAGALSLPGFAASARAAALAARGLQEQPSKKPAWWPAVWQSTLANTLSMMLLGACLTPSSDVLWIGAIAGAASGVLTFLTAAITWSVTTNLVHGAATQDANELAELDTLRDSLDASLRIGELLRVETPPFAEPHERSHADEDEDTTTALAHQRLR